MRDFFRSLRFKTSKALLPINISGSDKTKRKKTTTTTMSTAQTKRRAKTSKGTKPPPLRILCFGDSLTSGFPADNPYAGRMTEKIEEAFPGRKVECEVEGAPGDRVTDGRYLNRMQMSCECLLRSSLHMPVSQEN
jgi:lysophospholipase L1-like esterase